MALTDNGSGLSAADIAAVMGGNRNNGFGFGGDGSWWLLILFLFAFCNGGWGNGWGNGANNAMFPLMMGQQNTNNDMQRIIDQQSVMGGIAGLNNALVASQSAMTQGMNAIAMSLQNCCCENRAATADLKYTVATEACADRSAVTTALQQVIASNTANTQAILDKLCQQEIDALKAQNENLRTQLNMASLAASQNEQTATLQRTLNPAPIPAYVVQNPSCCNTGYYNGCGCGSVG